MIRLQTLGSVDLRDSEGREIRSVLAQPKRLALLSYLAIASPRGFLRRDQVLALFWPEQDAEHARAALNRAVYYLRKALGPGVLLSRGDEEIGVCGSGFLCDAAALQIAVAEGRYRDALELCRGDLLPGFFISDAPGFERWLEAERERLRQFALRAAWGRAESEQAAGNIALALHWARWAVDRAPWDEAGIRRLIVMLLEAGDRAGAVHAFERFARRLADELELAPSPETRALVDALRAPDSIPEASRTPREASPQRTDAVEVTVPRPAVIAERPPRWRTNWAPVTATVVVALAAAALLLQASWPRTLDLHPVSVVPVRNETGDAAVDSLARLATDWIEESLADVALFVESRRLVGGALGRARTSVTGSITRHGQALHLSAQIRTPQGVSWAIGPVATSLAFPAPAIDEVRQRVTGGIAALRNPSLASWFPLATSPPTLEAYTEFLQGLTADRPGQRRDALTHLHRAATLDTTFTLALLQAVQLHRYQIDTAGANSILRALDGLRDRLPPLQRDWLDWLAYRYRDPVRAYDAVRSAATVAPQRFLIDFARAARLARRPRETIRLLESVPFDAADRGQAPARMALLAESWHELAEHRRELRVARQARRLDMTDLQALSNEVRARAALGQSRAVIALLDTALALPVHAFYTPGDVMLLAARELAAHQHPEPARQALGLAIAWYRSRPSHGADTERDRWALAESLYLAGCWARSEPQRLLLLAEADSLFRVVAGDPQFALEIQGNLGAIAARRGDRRTAEQILASLETFMRSTSSPPGEGYFADATIRAVLGDAEGALASLREWVGGQGWDLHTQLDFESLMAHAQFREFTRPKG